MGMKENELIQSLLWAGMIALIGLAVGKIAEKGADQIWVKAFGTEPPRR